MIVLKLLFIAFSVNLVYELCHSVLYKTCLEAPLKRYVFLILKASVVDGIWISFFYLVTHGIFGYLNPLDNSYQLILFLIIALVFAYFWEIYSIKNKRWEYDKMMPIMLGVGLTPLIQLALTGIITFYLLFNVF